MVIIKALSGPFAGKEKELFPYENPMGFFTSMYRHGWRWESDYSRATQEEIVRIFRAEIIVRLMRALFAGLPVIFMNKTWHAGDKSEVEKMAQEIEMAIVESGMMITIESDDENGLVIGVRNYEVQ